MFPLLLQLARAHGYFIFYTMLLSDNWKTTEKKNPAILHKSHGAPRPEERFARCPASTGAGKVECCWKMSVFHSKSSSPVFFPEGKEWNRREHIYLFFLTFPHLQNISCRFVMVLLCYWARREEIGGIGRNDSLIYKDNNTAKQNLQAKPQAGACWMKLCTQGPTLLGLRCDLLTEACI